MSSFLYNALYKNVYSQERLSTTYIVASIMINTVIYLEITNIQKIL